MTKLQAIVDFCDQRTRLREITDFPGAFNGLQCTNDGVVTKIGAAVDAGLVPFRKAVEAKVDFLIVHHGLFWHGTKPFVGPDYAKLRTLIDGNLAVYSSHLPLDAHPEIGNNALLARKLGLEPCGTFLPYEGNDIGLVGAWSDTRDALKAAIRGIFGPRFAAIEHGSSEPRRVCVLTGSGASAVDHVRKAGADTLITGELRQHHFNMAQELELNLYLCGHYETETFGVTALAAEVAQTFGLKWEFIRTDCPL